MFEPVLFSAVEQIEMDTHEHGVPKIVRLLTAVIQTS